MQCPTLIQQLQEQPETLCLTPNERLGAFLTLAYGKAQRDAGHSIWLPAAIYSYEIWLQTQWETLVKQPSTETWPILLSPLTEDYYWHEIIKAHLPSHALLSPQALLSPMKQAWRFCHEWRIPYDHGAIQTTVDSQFFVECAHAYAQHLKQRHALDSSQLAPFLLSHFKKLALPRAVVFCGFESLTPQQAAWSRQWETEGTSVEQVHLHASQSHCTVHGFTDTEAEITAMAQWAKQQHKKNLSIGCVIPQLATIRPQVESIFRDILGAHPLLDEAPQPLYNISGGRPFYEAPIIHTALQSLQLPALSPEALSEWLRSPYLGAAEAEKQRRCLLDVAWREQPLGAAPPMEALYQYAKHKGEERTVLPLESGKACFATWPEKAPFATWIGYFCDLLNAVGWPGGSLSSLDYQYWQRWQALLEEYDRLSFSFPTLTAEAALQELIAHCGFVFQEETPQTSIQVLGLLEAAGLVFDACWVAQCHDGEWPATAQPNAYLPLRFQKEQGMPHCSPEQELLYFQKLTHHFSHCALTVIFSYPQQQEEALLQMSPLLAEFKQAPPPPPSPREKRLLNAPLPELVPYTDHKAPPVTEDEPIRGGASILQQQGACPFRAFAKIRLHARGLNHFQKGLTPLERGTLLHHTLELFWQATKNQARLLALSEKALAHRIAHCAHQAVNTLARRFPLSAALQSLECDRLCQLTLAWLTLEKAREPFTVLNTEALCSITIQGLPLQLRIDRIDALDNGDILVIDYKTSPSSIQSWFDERLDAPQLPLYAIVQGAEGVYFAQIRHEQVAFLGVSKAHYEKEGTSWAEQLARWERDLNQLAKNFMAGDAAVDPKQGAATCQHCDLDSLCRYES